ncbi:MAG: hypothetical protein AB1486_33725 [Planctomycetota bacterium]
MTPSPVPLLPGIAEVALRLERAWWRLDHARMRPARTQPPLGGDGDKVGAEVEVRAEAMQASAPTVGIAGS